MKPLGDEALRWVVKHFYPCDNTDSLRGSGAPVKSTKMVLVLVVLVVKA